VSRACNGGPVRCTGCTPPMSGGAVANSLGRPHLCVETQLAWPRRSYRDRAHEDRSDERRWRDMAVRGPWVQGILQDRNCWRWHPPRHPSVTSESAAVAPPRDDRLDCVARITRCYVHVGHQPANLAKLATADLRHPPADVREMGMHQHTRVHRKHLRIGSGQLRRTPDARLSGGFASECVSFASFS
jgi:hypothetical protein